MKPLSLTDSCLLDAYHRATGLECRREGEGLFKVQSSRFPSLFYDVRVSAEGAACNCPAGHLGKACRHIAKAVAAEFPALLAEWWRAHYQRQVDGNMERCKAFRKSLERLDAEAAKVLGTEAIAA